MCLGFQKLLEKEIIKQGRDYWIAGTLVSRLGVSKDFVKVCHWEINIQVPSLKMGYFWMEIASLEVTSSVNQSLNQSFTHSLGHSCFFKTHNFYHFLPFPKYLRLREGLKKNRFFCQSFHYQKNATKRSRQHAGKKYWEYAERRVCFLNEKIACPTPIQM